MLFGDLNTFWINKKLRKYREEQPSYFGIAHNDTCLAKLDLPSLKYQRKYNALPVFEQLSHVDAIISNNSSMHN